MVYRSTKTWGYDVGLSCAFRQWRADSHCRLIHGYALSVSLEFEADSLDQRNWVIDFGSLKPIKAWLQEEFDHRFLVAGDDPNLLLFMQMDAEGVAKVNVVQNVGCEAFAKLIAEHVGSWLHTEGYWPRVVLNSVEVREHGANSALYVRDR